MVTTTRDLQIAFARFVNTLYAHSLDEDEPKEIELSCWRPGDGVAHYRVEMNGRTPLGSRYWNGRAAAYHGLNVAADAIRWSRGE